MQTVELERLRMGHDQVDFSVGSRSSETVQEKRVLDGVPRRREALVTGNFSESGLRCRMCIRVSGGCWSGGVEQ